MLISVHNVSELMDCTDSDDRICALELADKAASVMSMHVSKIDDACGFRASKNMLMKTNRSLVLFIRVPFQGCVQWHACSHPSKRRRCADRVRLGSDCRFRTALVPTSAA